MPVTFKKKSDTAVVEKVISAKKSEQALSTLSAMVDPLYEQIMEAKALRSKLAALDKQIKPVKEEFVEQYNVSFDVDMSKVILGKKHQLKVSAGSTKREVISIDKVFDMLESVQEGLFQEVAKVNLGDLDKYLTPEQLGAILTVIRDEKARSLTAVND